MIIFNEYKFTLTLMFAVLSLNFAFGNAFMQVTVFGIPLNEFLCLLLFVRWFLLIFNISKHKILFALVMAWSSYSLVLLLPIGLISQGLDAGRDATGQIDILMLPIMAALIYRNNTFLTQKSFDIFIIVALSLEFLDRILFGPLWGSSDALRLSASFFGGGIGSQLVIFLSLFYGLCSLKKKRLFVPIYLIILSCSLILLHQNRYLYVGFIFSCGLFLYTRKDLLKYLPLFAIFVLFAFVFVRYLTSNLLDVVPDPSRLVKYRGSDISLKAIYDHLLTSFGFDNAVYVGASGGVGQRIGWWSDILQTAINNVNIMFFGQGFGIPLTSDYVFKVIREPHNSYISVFARGGIVYFIVWFIIQYLLFSKSRRAYFCFKKYASFDNVFEFYSEFGLAVHLMSFTVLITALVEPAFELPPYAIGFYALNGILMGLYWRYQHVIAHR